LQGHEIRKMYAVEMTVRNPAWIYT
jgi:hypothetical protein